MDSAYHGYTKLDLPYISPAVRGVIVQMLFNLGTRGVQKFKRFLDAIRAKDYKRAALEMLDSKWHREDVGARAVRLARIVFEAKE
jgi:GH24 family phage-related lysozyme (muramidase)